MKQFSLILFFLSLSFYTVSAQQQAQIKMAAKNILNATVKSDFITVARYTHPKVIKMMGGQQKMIDLMKKGLAQMKSQGASIKDGIIGDPGKIYETATARYAVVPEKIIMQSNGTEFYSTSSLLAISNDKGKTWSFVDAGNISRQNLLMLFPDFPKEAEIPKRTEPVVIP